MTTYVIDGFSVQEDDFGNRTEDTGNPIQLSLVLPNDPASISYSVDFPPTIEEPIPQVLISPSPITALINGVPLGSNVDAYIGFVVSPEGTHIILALFDNDLQRDHIFNIAGDPLTYPTNLVEWEALEGSLTGAGQATGAFAPGVNIPLTSFALNTSTTEDDVLVGTSGPDSLNGGIGDDQLFGNAGADTLIGGADNDFLDGGAGDDFINPGDNAGGVFGFDSIVTGTGNNTVNFSQISTGWASLNYNFLDGVNPITVDIDGQSNTGSVDMGASGFDTLINVQNPLNSGFTTGGLSVRGTSGDDTFDVTTDTNQWMEVRGRGGADTINISGNGLVRIDYREGGDVTADLGAGTVTQDGFTDTITGTVWEIRTDNGNDSVLGSSADESFILRGGTDTVDGAGGFDRLRYDQSGLAGGVTINFNTGQATGTWNGGAFSHNFSNIEWARGSEFDDTITGDGNAQQLAGGAGNDTITGGGNGDTFVIGNRSVYGTDGGTDVITDFTIGEDGFDFSGIPDNTTQITAAFAAAVNTPGGAQVVFSDGTTIVLQGITAAQAQALNPFAAAVVTGGVPTIPGTSGNDSLTGTAGGEQIEGGDGDDTIFGNGGGDTLLGGNGVDLIDATANEGNDILNPGENDGSGDTILMGVGDDTVSFSDISLGFVSLEYNAPTNGLTGPIDVTVDGGTGTGSIVKGAAGVDGTDTLENVNNVLAAGWTTGGLSITGTSGDDNFDINVVGEQWMSIRMGDGVDSVSVNGDALLRLDFRDAMGGIDVNLANGAIANDGYGNAESITGSNAIWEIYGSMGDGTVTATSGYESYRYGGGSNSVSAFERARYDVNDVTGITADLSTGTVTGTSGTGAFTDTLLGVEYLRGSNAADDLSDSESSDRLDGKDGADIFRISGGQDIIGDFEIGIDQLDVSSFGLSDAEVQSAFANATDVPGGALVNFNNGSTLFFGNLTAAQVQSLDPLQAAVPNDDDLLIGTNGAETLNGGAGDDTLFAQDGADRLLGGAGNDILDGGPGDDFINPGDNAGGVFGFDSITSGTGNNTINLSQVSTGWVSLNYGFLDGLNPITVDIDGLSNDGTVDMGASGLDTIINVQNPLNSGFTTGGLSVRGTSGDDTFNVAPAQNQWMEVVGREGADDIDISGSGFVRISYHFSSGDVTANLASGSVTQDGATDTITGNAKEIRTGDGNDSVQGSSADESFILRAGTDTVNGADGFDRLRYDRFGVDSGVTIDFTTGVATGTWFSQSFTHNFSNMEWFRGSQHGDTIIGDDEVQLLEGAAGNDTITGGGGIGGDTFVIGNRTLYGANGGTDLITDFTIGTDAFDFVGINDTIAEINAAFDAAIDTTSGAEIEFADGTTIILQGVTAAQAAALDPFAAPASSSPPPTTGDDVIQGTLGDDNIDLLAGNDEFSGNSGNDTVLGNTGNDTIEGNNGDDSIAGDAGDDVLFGNDGQDTLLGGADNDILNGGNGADSLDGGDGIDTASFEGADGRVLVDLLVDGATAPYAVFYTEGASEGDVFVNIENGIGSAVSDQFRGDNGANMLDGANGWDRLYGRQGDDTLIGGNGGDMLYGNAGADIMSGGTTAQRDRFIYFRDTDTGVGEGNRDVITDFQSGTDRIEISRIDANIVLGGPRQDFIFIADTAFSNTAGELRYEQTGTETILQADRNGDGVSDWEIELTGTVTLQSGDFVF